MTELTIERLGHHGDGIAEGPVFVPRTLPGERVEGTVTDGRLDQPRIQQPSHLRVSPPCPHFKRCGGCALQHAADGFVADWKADVVRHALLARDLPAPIRGVHTSPPRSRRRATLTARRTKSGVLLGFHARGSDVVVDIPECHLLTPGLMATLPAVREIVPLGASRKGEISVMLTQSDAGADVSVMGGKPADGALRMRLGELAGKHRLARLSWNGEILAERERPLLPLGRARVPLPPGAFLQATVEGQTSLQRLVAEAVGPARHVADLFAGLGTFALPLAETAQVLAVEGEALLLEALDRGWRETPGLRPVKTLVRDLFRRPLLPDELSGFDAVVLDPPRAGAAAQVAEVARAKVPVVAFVSCNPVSFARDAKTLVDAGYRLEWVDVVDQFRWSPHVELAARFTMGHSAP